MKVYISGKVTGLKDYITHFCKAELDLMERGYSVVNPALTNMTLPQDTTYDEYMAMSMLMLSMCDTIYMLDNWIDSPGAKKEFEYAVRNNYTLMFEGESPCMSIS